MLRERIAGIERCTALRIPGNEGIGAVASRFLRASAGQAGRLNPHEFLALAEPALDLLTLAAASCAPRISMSRESDHSPSTGSRRSSGGIFPSHA